MKRTLSLIAMAVAVCLFLTALCGCSASPAALKYNDTVITTNMYQFYMSRYKAQILSNYNSGQDNAAFWTHVLDEGSGETIATFFEDIVAEIEICFNDCVQTCSVIYKIFFSIY